MLGLRRTAGVEPGEAGTALLDSEAGRRLSEFGLIEVIGGRLRVAKPLLTDAVIREVLAIEGP
jgi:hypothetical protein